jgi:hypothetical protein
MIDMSINHGKGFLAGAAKDVGGATGGWMQDLAKYHLTTPSWEGTRPGRVMPRTLN